MKTLEDVLEEIRPTPDPEFVADMERRMRRGFPAQARAPVLLPVLRPRAFAAAAASACLAAVVAVSLIGGSDGDRERRAGRGRGGRRSSARRRRRARSAGALERDRVVPASPPAGGGGWRPGPTSAGSSETRSSRSRPTPTGSTTSRTRSSARPTGATDSCFSPRSPRARRGQQRVLRAPSPRRRAPADAERALPPGDRARPERVGHRHDRRVRVAPRPAAHGQGAAHQPAAPARAGRDRHCRERPPPPARDRRQPDHGPAPGVARRARADRVLHGLRRVGGRGRGRRRG